MGASLAPEALSPAERALFELVGEICGVGSGIGRVELSFRDGRFHEGWLHARVARVSPEVGRSAEALAEVLQDRIRQHPRSG